MMREPLYYDLKTKAWVDDPSTVALEDLIRVYEVEFSHLEEISSSSNGNYAMSEDEESRAAAYKFGDPRESMRSTYLVIHAYYEWNGGHGCVVKNTDTLLCTMTIQDDGMGNIINDTFTPNSNGLPTRADILDLIEEGILASVDSSLLGLREHAYVESSIGKIEKEFNLLV